MYFLYTKTIVNAFLHYRFSDLSLIQSDTTNEATPNTTHGIMAPMDAKW